MFLRPTIMRLIPMIFVGGAWVLNTTLAYIRGKKILTNDSPLTEGKTRGGMSPKRSTSTKRPIAPPPAPKPKKPVNCKNLVPPRDAVRRWHCNMGDGREGDCPIFLGKTSKCDYKGV